ncbi:MAG TPA: MFS transporter [Dictyobacter sp.]|jgi:MFS family permease|nr:MFS transporter [Dictyobacter sp.]
MKDTETVERTLTPIGKILGSRTFVSLRVHHNYRLYFSGQFLSQIGTWLQSAAMAWLVLQLTHSALAVGELTFWQFGPYIVLGLFGGAISDRLDHRLTLIATQAALALCSGTIAVLTLFHIVTVWEAFVIAAIRGTVLILNNPSRQAFIFQMVGRKELPNAIALNSSVANATRIIGPGLGGLLIAAFGVGICFGIDAISYVAVIVAMLMMRVDELLPMEHRGRPSVLRGLAEGLNYVWRTQTVLLALLIFFFICTASINFTVLLPLIASNTLHSGAEVFGLLTACFGAGALIGALISASIARESWRILLVSAFGFGMSEVLLAIQHTIIGAVLALLLTGICYTMYTSNTNTLIQLATPPYLQGRVAGLYSYIFSGTNSFGSLIAGALADTGGTALAFFVGGGTALVCAAIGVSVRWRTLFAPKDEIKSDPVP